MKMAGRDDIDAVICLGAVIRGETAHFDHVAYGASMGITRVALDSGKPVIFGVLTTDNAEQAVARVGQGLTTPTRLSKWPGWPGVWNRSPPAGAPFGQHLPAGIGFMMGCYRGASLAAAVQGSS